VRESFGNPGQFWVVTAFGVDIKLKPLAIQPPPHGMLQQGIQFLQKFSCIHW